MGDAVTDAALDTTDIAIVGMAAHLPDAPSVAAFWENLTAGRSATRRFTREELLEAGESAARLADKNYVPAGTPLQGFEMFEGEFFGFSPKESAVMDPQHRQFLEVAWEALEDAGHMPERFPGAIGVFAGCGMGSYLYFNLCSNPDLMAQVGLFLLRHTGNDKDFLATRVSHVFDLRGPSVNIQTACSTSLVAIHYAAQSLLSGECDLALAGGVTIELPQGLGYIYHEGEVLSPDGTCHAFDHRAQGTVFGSGAGCVALRRLEDARRDGDHIWAVLKGSAVNNDGASKAGYLAPSVDGQAAAVAEAISVAGVPAESIGYIECHGTGTYLGDPIEIAALTEAFRRSTEGTGFCRIGSVKTNIGHLDTAAGVASLIKAALAVKEGRIPPSLGFEAPNPAIDFAASPFRVNTALSDWAAEGAPAGPRRAGVNSLGVGGTNAHAILEEPPERAAAEPSDWPYQPIMVSGRTKAALDANAAALAAHLRAHPEQPLADVAYTLKEGRRAFEKRRVLVAESHEEAARLLEENDPRRVFNHAPVGADPEVVFLLPGGGAQYPGMARDLYETEPVFRDWMEAGLELLAPKVDADIRALWLPPEGSEAAAAEALKRTSLQLPLIMIVEHALAQLWMSWGVRPGALMGHSLGENTAACLAGVLSFEDCIGLTHLRGALIDPLPAGGTLAVGLSEAELAPLLGAELDLACVNAPEMTVASGPKAAVDAFEAALTAREIECKRVPVNAAAHSRMFDPILAPFGDYLRSIALRPPQIPIVSNRTGTWLTDAEATDPDYWVGHLRHTVRFADGVATLAERADRVYLEVGPGKMLRSLVSAHGAVPAQQVISSMRHPQEALPDDAFFLMVLAQLSAVGVAVDWEPVWGADEAGRPARRRVPLPTYRFQRAPYFIERRAGAAAEDPAAGLLRAEDLAEWGYRPVWRPRLADLLETPEAALAAAGPETWLLFMDDADGAGLGRRLAAKLRAAGQGVIEVHAGDAFAKLSEGVYALSPERGRESYDMLVRELMAEGHAPARIVHLWLATEAERFRPGSSFFHRNLEQGFYSLLFLAQAITEEGLPKPIRITQVTTGAQKVAEEALPHPEKATAIGPVRVIPRELPGVTCQSIDVVLPEAPARSPGGVRSGRKARAAALDALADRLLEDLAVGPEAAPEDIQVAYRGAKRYVRDHVPAPLPPVAEEALPYREGGTYLVTGGFGGIGLAIAEELHAKAGANLVLLARTPLPPRADWAGYLKRHAPQDATARRIRAVERLEGLGARVMVAAADVCNAEEMRAALAAVAERFGPVHGVVHAAGTVDDGPLLTKTPAGIEDVFTPKIHGLQVLSEIFPDGALDWMVLFASTSTVIAPVGQVDYVAANEYLNAVADARAGGRTRVISLNWGIWDEVGMAAEAVAERLGAPVEAPAEPAGEALLDRAGFDGAGHRIFESDLAVAERWVLDGHRTGQGAALLPGTGYLELAAEALAAQGEGEGTSFEIRDLYFLRPLFVADDAPRAVRVRLARHAAGYGFAVGAETLVDGRRAFEPNAEATLALGHLAPPEPLDLRAIEARCTGAAEADGRGLPSAQEAHLRFGPRWRVLRAYAYGAGEGLARLALDAAFHGDLEAGYRLHPALLDIATGWAMELVPGYDGTHLWVPVAYGRVRVHGRLPAEIVSWVRLGEAGDGVARLDVTIADPEGRVLLEIEGFSLKRLEAGAAVAPARAPTAAEVDFVAGAPAQAQPLSPAEERLRIMLSQGIRPAEGAESFTRALALGRPRLVVSSMPLPALIAAAQAVDAAEEGAGQSFERPDLDTDYVAPATDVERTLAGFWEELLGVSQVGVEDSFFDLGGHSLIAVRLFAMVKKAYRIELPISVLFEAPTIAKCAALIEERIGPQDGSQHGSQHGPQDGSADGAAGMPGGGTRAPRPRFSHLVAMHEGEGGPKTPFFLVAGMFGNVLNLRHLAHLVGADRPFYGLQARGLLGGEAPHETLVEAAADCIAEMRQVQPHGPYLVGGFSGGGITAFEIARQLKAAGEETALVVMLDTALPVRPPLSAKDRALIQLQELKRRGLAYPAIWLRNRIAWEIHKIRSRFEEPEAVPETRFHNEAIEAAFIRAISVYELHEWDGPVALFRPPMRGTWKVSGGRMVDSQRAYVMEDNGWRDWAPKLRVIEVPGDHDAMVLEPNVRVLAARMKAEIEAAEAAAGGPAPMAAAAE